MPKKSTTPCRKSSSSNKRKSTGSKQTNSVKIRDITNNRGTVEIAGRDIKTYYVNKGLNGNEIGMLFKKLYAELEASKKISQANKDDAKALVEEIQSTVTDAAQKKEKLDEGFLARRFRNIARMGPDILDLVVKTLANPMLGITDLVNKIAKKAKEETQSG